MLFRLIVSALVILACGRLATADDVVRGRSTELGIEFSATGGAFWCQPSVAIALTASKSTPFQGETVDLQRMLGRVRAVVQSECPAVEAITLEGRVKTRLVYAAEMRRIAGWRIVALDLVTRAPICPSQILHGADCWKPLEAYSAAVKLMRGPSFAKAEFISILGQGDGDGLMWSAGPAVGKLNVFKEVEFESRFADSGQLADAIVTDIATTCTANGGSRERDTKVDQNHDLAQRSFYCRQDNKPINQNVVIVERAGTIFYVYGLWSEEPNSDAAAAMAKDLIEAVQKRH